MLPTKKLKSGNGGNTGKIRMMGGKKGILEIASVMSLKHLAEATEIL